MQILAHYPSVVLHQQGKSTQSAVDVERDVYKLLGKL
jgi:hypothetical protein